MMSEAASEIQQVLRATLAELVEHLRGRRVRRVDVYFGSEGFAASKALLET